MRDDDVVPMAWLETDPVPLTPDVDVSDPVQRSAWYRANACHGGRRWWSACAGSADLPPAGVEPGGVVPGEPDEEQGLQQAVFAAADSAVERITDELRRLRELVARAG